MSVADFMHREHIVVENAHKIIEYNSIRHTIALIYWEPYIKDTHTLAVKTYEGEITTSAHITVITRCSSPYHPPHMPFDADLCYDSDSILHMNRIPKTM